MGAGEETVEIIVRDNYKILEKWKFNVLDKKLGSNILKHIRYKYNIPAEFRKPGEKTWVDADIKL